MPLKNPPDPNSTYQVLFPELLERTADATGPHSQRNNPDRTRLDVSDPDTDYQTTPERSRDGDKDKDKSKDSMRGVTKGMEKLFTNEEWFEGVVVNVDDR